MSFVLSTGRGRPGTHECHWKLVPLSQGLELVSSTEGPQREDPASVQRQEVRPSRHLVAGTPRSAWTSGPQQELGLCSSTCCWGWLCSPVTECQSTQGLAFRVHGASTAWAEATPQGARPQVGAKASPVETHAPGPPGSGAVVHRADILQTLLTELQQGGKRTGGVR